MTRVYVSVICINCTTPSYTHEHTHARVHTNARMRQPCGQRDKESMKRRWGSVFLRCSHNGGLLPELCLHIRMIRDFNSCLQSQGHGTTVGILKSYHLCIRSAWLLAEFCRTKTHCSPLFQDGGTSRSRPSGQMTLIQRWLNVDASS